MVGALTLGARSRGAQGAPDADIRKADYLYLEALRAKAQGKPDAAFSLLDRAHELNPEDKDIGVELAVYLLNLTQSDSMRLPQSVELMRSYADANPADFFQNVRYALLNEQIGNRDEALRIWRRLHYADPAKLEVTFRYAALLGQGGDREDRLAAIALYDSVETSEGMSIPLSTKKIQLYYSQLDTAAILAEADRLRNSAPQKVDFQVFSGEIYSMFGLNDQARAFYDRAAELDPSSGLVYYSRAQFFNQLGDSAAFDREVFEALKQKDLDVDTKIAMLRSYIQEMYSDSTQQPKVRQLFDVLIDQHPHEHDIHSLYARYLILTRDYAASAEQTERALDLDPADEESWEMLTSLYLQVENLAKAEQTALRSLHFYPDNARQHLVLGSIYGQEKEWDKAAAQYDRALAAADSADTELLSSIYGAMGDNLYAQEKADSAFVRYQKAIEYNPNNYLALNNCAYYLACESKELDRALRMIEKVVEAEPDQPTSMDTYAWVLFKMKDYAKAREVIDRTLEIATEHGADILEHAGDIYFMDGEPDRAVEFWRQALEQDPDNELLARKVKHKTYFFK